MPSDYQRYVEIIDCLWDDFVNFNPDDDERARYIGLPRPYVSPTPAHAGVFRGMQYYWDSYFTLLGLVRRGRIELARDMVDNFVYLFRRYGVIPAANRLYLTGMSQPPFLTSMIREVYERTADRAWLQEVIQAAEAEYRTYWMKPRTEQGPLPYIYHYLPEHGLNRYCDALLFHVTAEDESGWDLTWRFEERCLDVLPIDLNALLYRYELDFAAVWRELGEAHRASQWEAAAARRKAHIDELMWDEATGFYYDYDYVQYGRLPIRTLAGFTPLWAKLASREQAERVVAEALPRFEHSGGLANTEPIERVPYKQWDYPNGWPNLQWLTLKGLANYGFQEQVGRLARKWLELNIQLYEQTGQFWEKYDVVARDVGQDGHYPTQSGFGWTLGVFVASVEDFLTAPSVSKL